MFLSFGFMGSSPPAAQTREPSLRSLQHGPGQHLPSLAYPPKKQDLVEDYTGWIFPHSSCSRSLWQSGQPSSLPIENKTGAE